MPFTLLFDLDDTLLNTNMNAFIPAYFQALSRALADKVAPDVMLPALMAGTNAMLSNLDPALTLKEVFDAYFFPALKLDRASLQSRIDRFYEQDFPSLGSLTSPIPEAVSLVDWAFQQGHRVVIATNPLFPLKAVHHRMRWAGLPPEKYPFALVSSYETFHFTKENVAYYPEVLAQLGWPDDPAVMVGDDFEREVKPTRAAGLPVYWVKKQPVPSVEDFTVPQGPLATFQGWLEVADPSSLKVNFTGTQALEATLRSTPAALATLTSSLTDMTWSSSPAQGEWSLTEIICHLRDVEQEVNLPRLRKVLKEKNPFLPGLATDEWARERCYAAQDGRRALVEFIASRKESLGLLQGLDEEWSRQARHAIFGNTTLQELVGIIAGHDRVHIQQIWNNLHA